MYINVSVASQEVIRDVGATCGRFGVLQGSVLGPLLYILYTAELSQVVARHGLQMHVYADDNDNGELCISAHLPTLLLLRSTSSLHQSACISDVYAWLSANILPLNASKTQLMWLGSRLQIKNGIESHLTKFQC